MKRFLIQTY